MNVCDFSASHLRFTSNRIGNTARLQLDALCDLTHAVTDQTTRFALTAPCIAENMYQTEDLIQVPTCEFRMIASEAEYRMIKDYPTHDLDADMAREKDEKHQTFDGSLPQLTELRIVVSESKATPVRNYGEFREAFLENRGFVGTTEVSSPDGKLRARMEYPVKTSNILSAKNLWQVDAGPLAYPVFTRKVRLNVEWFARAYIVFNAFDWAEIIIHQAAPIRVAGKEVAVSTQYHAPFRVTTKSELWAMK